MIMNIRAIRSDKIYTQMMSTDNTADKVALFRNQLLGPFEMKYQCMGIPLKSEQPDQYDAITMTTAGGGYEPSTITKEHEQVIRKIRDDSFWADCEQSISKALHGFEEHGIQLPVQEYIFTVMLNDPKNPMSSLTGDCCGDGGIPGYITGTIIPNEKSLAMLPVTLAHEANHNVRWQFLKWSQNITLADMIVSEGLAENFATYMYDENHIGMWVKNTSPETLEHVIKPEIHKNLGLSDFQLLSSYLYGDEIMSMRGANPIGMPYCGGYACGYALIKYYLHKTNKSIYEASILPTQEILDAVPEFWELH